VPDVALDVPAGIILLWGEEHVPYGHEGGGGEEIPSGVVVGMGSVVSIGIDSTHVHAFDRGAHPGVVDAHNQLMTGISATCSR